VKFIDGHKSRFGIEPICRVLTEHGCKIALEERVRLKGCRLAGDTDGLPVRVTAKLQLLI
jgi:hypothetical protein